MNKCIYKIAQNEKDIGICDHVTTTLGRNACRLKIAKISEDKQLCENITIKAVKDLCYEHFSE